VTVLTDAVVDRLVIARGRVTDVRLRTGRTRSASTRWCCPRARSAARRSCCSPDRPRQRAAPCRGGRRRRPVRAQPGHPALWADAAAGRGARDWWVSGH